MSEPAKVVVLSEEQLEQLLERAVRRGAESRPDDEWMTAEEVARMLDVKRQTIPTLVRREGLPCYRPGRAYTFRRSEVIAWLERRAEGERRHTRRHGATLRSISGG